MRLCISFQPGLCRPRLRRAAGRLLAEGLQKEPRGLLRTCVLQSSNPTALNSINVAACMQVAADNADPLSPLDEAGSLDTSIASPLALQPSGSERSSGGGGEAAAAAAVDAAKRADDTAAGGKGGSMERPSMGLSGLSSIGAGGTPQQRREWALRKLCGLVDAVKQLEVAAYSERSDNANQSKAEGHTVGAGSCGCCAAR